MNGISRPSRIAAAVLAAGLCLTAPAFGQALKPIQPGDYFAISAGNEIWRLPDGDTDGIGELYTRPPTGGSLWGVGTDDNRNLYYIYEIAPSHVLARVTAAGVTETLVTLPLAGTQYFVEDFTASESGTVYILFRARSINDAWIVRVGSDRKAIDHRSGLEVSGPLTSPSFPAGLRGRLAISATGEVYVLTSNIGGTAPGVRLSLAPAGGALQSLGTVANVFDIEFSEGQLWGARTTTGTPPVDLVKISLPSATVESKGTFTAFPILKAGSAVLFGMGEIIEVALDTFAATVRKWRESRQTRSQNYTGTKKKKKCPPITVTATGESTVAVGTGSRMKFVASGGEAPYAYAVSGEVPPGAEFLVSPEDARLIGKLTRRGVFSFVVRATDKNGCTGSTAVTIDVTCPRPFPLEPLPDAYVGQDYENRIAVLPSDTARILGPLPSELTATPTVGGVSVRGKPTKPGVYLYTVEVTSGADPECKYTLTFRIIVGNGPSDTAESRVQPKEADSIFALGSKEALRLNALLEELGANNPKGRVALEGANELYATAVISYRQGGVIVSEAAVPVSPPTTRARFFLDYRTGVSSGTGKIDVYTGFAAVNRGSASARITVRLRDGAGAVTASGTGTLAAGAQVAKFLHQIAELAPDFVLPATFPTATRFATLELDSDQAISVLALRLTINQRGDLLLTSTPGADLTQPAAKGTLYFPQLADGGGWTTALVLLNTTDAVERGVLKIFDDNGAPLSVKMESGESGTEFRYTIQPGGFVRLATDGSPSAVRAGSVQLVPDEGGSAPAGAGIFSLVQDGTTTTESGVPAALTTTSARIYVDKSAGHDTGLAVVNAGSGQIAIRAEAFGAGGATMGTGTLTLAGSGHAAKFAGAIVSGLADGFTGVLEVSAPTPFAALTLRSLTNERGDFLITTFPVADMTRAAPSPMVFPQVVAGGGYGTEFVLLNAGTAEKQVVLRFYDATGKPAAVSTLVVGTTP